MNRSPMPEGLSRSRIDARNHILSAFHIFPPRFIDLSSLVIPPLFFLILAGPLLSCGIGVRTKAVLGGKLHIKVGISENANMNSPIALDVLLVYDEALLKRLIKMPSREWFEKRTQITRDHIKGEGLDYWAWEFVPGQSVATQILPLKPKAKGGIIFANYFSAGEHRSRIDPFKDLVIHLQEKGFAVEVLE
jgi:type VI secretion system protein